MYYRPEKAVAADVIPYYYNGKFYLYYLKDYRGSTDKDEGISWHLVESENLTEFTDRGIVLKSGGERKQDYFVYTGSVIKHGDLFYIFYTGHNHKLIPSGGRQEVILMATSRDLVNWEKDENFRLESPDWLDRHDFRDPFVYADGGKFKMLLAGRAINGGDPDRRGATYVAESDDLKNWSLIDTPFYAPEEFFMHECPDLFKIGDWYYFVFSEFNERLATRYRKAKSPSGPWLVPENDTFDCSSFYAAKTVSDGKRRLLFGWNPIKNEEKDCGNWQWGGNIVVHELVQDAATGDLSVKCPEEIKDRYTEKNCVLCAPFEATSAGGYKRRNICTLPENCRIELKYETGEVLREFGLYFNADGDFTRGYILKFQPQFNRLCFEHKRGIWNFKLFDVESERYCPVSSGEKHSISIIREGSILEVYADGKVALSTRMFDYSDGYFGVFSTDSDVRFTEAEIYTEKKV